jgi:hypothetical protein
MTIWGFGWLQQVEKTAYNRYFFVRFPFLWNDLIEIHIPSYTNSSQVKLRIAAASLRLQFLLKDLLERDGVGGELDNSLVKLVKCHLICKECPAEFRLVINVGDFWYRVGFGGW